MTINASSGFNTGGPYGTGDVESFIQQKLMGRVQRQLVLYQFGKKLTLEKHKGVTYAGTRYDRVPLPFTSLSEGVPPVGQAMSPVMVSAVCAQWGDSITLTDVANLTIKHPLFEVAIKLIGIQEKETYERNTINTVMSGTNVNFASYDNTARSARSGIRNGGTAATSDIMTPHELNRIVAIFDTNGVPEFSGPSEETQMKDIKKRTKASKDPASAPHYICVLHPNVATDLRENTTISTAWSYSDINRLYNMEIGEWGGIRFCKSNMIPSFVGVAAVQGTPGVIGSLATGTYYIVVTGSDNQKQFESRIYQVSNSISVVGPNGSISVTLPSTPGFTYSVYIGTSNTPTNVGLCVQGPSQGPMQGQAIQLTGGTTVTITGVGVAQVPPAAPATGVTVYPSFFFGEDAYGQVDLQKTEYFYLKGADKSDKLNQLRIVGWKNFWGTLIMNNSFFARVESTTLFTGTYS